MLALVTAPWTGSVMKIDEHGRRFQPARCSGL
jgi:hypothetical protein